ncbi:MAG: DotA/TraY family protein [Gallionella sp.]
MNLFKKGLIAIGVAVLALLPTVAFGSSLFEPVEGDVSIKILKSIFGSAMGGTGGADPFGPLFQILNASALMIAGVLASYTLIVGTMHTAHDGEALGKKWSSLWVPINITLFTALMLPLSSGYNTGEMVYLWVVKQGIGLGDKAWSAYVDSENTSSVSVAAPSVTQLAQDTLLSLTCVEHSKKAIIDAPGWDSGIGVGKQANSTGYFYNSHNAKRACGSVDFADIASHREAAGDGWFDFKLFGRGGSNPAPIVQAHKDAYDAMVAVLEPVAIKLASTQDPGNLISVMNDAGVAYQTKITDAVKAFSDANNENTVSDDNMKKDGWMLAGFYYVALAEQQNKASAAAQRIPVTSRPFERDSDALVYAQEQIRMVADTNKMGITQASKGTDIDGEAGKFIADAFANIDLDKLSTSQHPITFMADVGNRFGNWAIAFTGVLATIGLTGAIPIVGGATTAVLQAVSPMVSTVWILCITISFTLQYLIPALPAIIWIGVLVGYFIFVIEGMVGVTLLLIASMSPDNDGIVGKNGQAYMLILKAFLKPFLMVFGFVVSLVLSKVMFDFLNQIFAAYLMNSESGLSSVMASISGALIYCIMVITLMKKLFEMVHVIPDQLLRWMGSSHSSDLGSSGQAGASGMQTATIAASTQIGHMGSNMSGGMDKLKNGMDKSRADDEKKAKGNGDGGNSDNNAVRQAKPEPKTES